MTTVIAIANQKGGVGKTTTTVNLAYALSQLGQRVLAVDLDPQSSLTVYAGLDVLALDEEQRTLYFGLVHDKPANDLISTAEHFDVLPNSIRLASGEAELLVSPLTGPQLLSNLLKPIQDGYDYILIDCPPTLTLLTVNALAAADQVLIPVKTDLLSLYGIALFLESVEKTRRRANPGLKILGVLPTMHSAHYSHDQAALESLKELEQNSGIRVFDPINRSTGYDKAVAEGKPTLEAAPNTPGAQNYYKLAEAILDGAQQPA